VFLQTAGQSALLPVDCADWAKRPLRVYLDGLDEIGDGTLREHALRLAQTSEAEGLNCQVIMTARDYLHDPLLTWVPRVSLGGLTDCELRSLAMQWLDSDVAVTEDLLRQLNALPSVKTLARVPLLATVTILVFKRTRRIPANRARLYLTFANMLCGGWDLAKGIVRLSRFDLNSKMHVLSSLASELHFARLRRFDDARFRRVSRRVLSRGKVGESGTLLEEVLRDGLVSRTANDLHFSHLTFQEFLAAKEILGDPNASRMDMVLAQYLKGDNWWKEVLAFAIGLSENPERTAEWLFRRAPSSSTSAGVYQMLEDAFPDFDRDEYRLWADRGTSHL
jgi:predicted NACHT family NTPase